MAAIALQIAHVINVMATHKRQSNRFVLDLVIDKKKPRNPGNEQGQTDLQSSLVCRGRKSDSTVGGRPQYEDTLLSSSFSDHLPR